MENSERKFVASSKAINNKTNEKFYNPYDIMCLVKITAKEEENFHYFKFEVRQNGFYLYNSWNNLFSNEWGSGILKEDPV